MGTVIRFKAGVTLQSLKLRTSLSAVKVIVFPGSLLTH